MTFFDALKSCNNARMWTLSVSVNTYISGWVQHLSKPDQLGHDGTVISLQLITTLRELTLPKYTFVIVTLAPIVYISLKTPNLQNGNFQVEIQLRRIHCSNWSSL